MKLSLAVLALATAACSRETPPPEPVAIAPDASSLRFPEFGPVPALAPPADDPPTPEKIELGRALFYDTRLSGSGGTSCDSCHIRAAFFQDALRLPTPDRSSPFDSPTIARNTTSLLNVEHAPVFRWDGSGTSLVAVLAFPFAEPNVNVARLPRSSAAIDVPAAQVALKRRFIEEVPGYAARFERAFGVDPGAASPEAVWELTGRALRAFLAPAESAAAPFDRWNAGDDGAIDASARRGLDVFRGKGRCCACHQGPFFTDFSFHNVSSSPPGADGSRADEGRWLVTHDPADRGAFLTPTLRQAYDTSPYFHDGSRPALRDVITFLASPDVLADPLHDPILAPPIALSEDDVDDLIAFVKSLRGAPVVGLERPAPGDLP